MDREAHKLPNYREIDPPPFKPLHRSWYSFSPKPSRQADSGTDRERKVAEGFGFVVIFIFSASAITSQSERHTRRRRRRQTQTTKKEEGGGYYLLWSVTLHRSVGFMASSTAAGCGQSQQEDAAPCYISPAHLCHSMRCCGVLQTLRAG